MWQSDCNDISSGLPLVHLMVAFSLLSCWLFYYGSMAISLFGFTSCSSDFHFFPSRAVYAIQNRPINVLLTSVLCSHRRQLEHSSPAFAFSQWLTLQS